MNYSSHVFFIRFWCAGCSRIAICGNGACDVSPCHVGPRIRKQVAIRVKDTLYLERLFQRAWYSGTRIPTVAVIGGSTRTSKMPPNLESI